MTKTLYLMRHAKSVQSAPDNAPADHARALSLRGRKAAQAMAKAIAARHIMIDRVYSSTAKRARETVKYMPSALKTPTISFRDSLYLASDDEIISFVQALPETVSKVLLIGHNPGLHDAALTFIGRAARGQVKALDLLRTKFPTGALCTLTFDVPVWKKVGAGTATLVSFIRPRDLETTAP
jgi:phosphohistidine phosphatase